MPRICPAGHVVEGTNARRRAWRRFSKTLQEYVSYEYDYCRACEVARDRERQGYEGARRCGLCGEAGHYRQTCQKAAA